MNAKLTIFVAILSLLFPVSLLAQTPSAIMPERRVFLWDVTVSMVGASQKSFTDAPGRQAPTSTKGMSRKKPYFNYNGYPWYRKNEDIFDDTRARLIKLINDIQTESTEIIVLPFRNGLTGECCQVLASERGKADVIQWVNNWDNLKSGATWTYTSVKDAISRYFSKDRRNKLILLTDGEPSSAEERENLKRFLSEWTSQPSVTRGKEIETQGNAIIYVMLNEEAYRIKEELDDYVKNSGGGVLKIFEPDEKIDECAEVSFLSNASLYIREYYQKSGSDGNGKIRVAYSLKTRVPLPQGAEFSFSLEPNPWVTIDSSLKIQAEDGVLYIPFVLNFQSINEFRENFPGEEASVVLNCIGQSDNIMVTDPSINLSLICRSEPRATITWKTIKPEE